MLIAAMVVAALAALLHIVFFLFESVFWTRPAVFGRFGIASQADADTIRPMAYNQGFYNLALAIGVVVGILLIETPGGAHIAGKAIVPFGTACMAFAGVILFSTGSQHRQSALIQFVPARAALIVTSLAPAV